MTRADGSGLRALGSIAALSIQPLALRFQGQPSSPIIVKIIQPPSEASGLADVLIGSLGLSGVIALGSILVGLLFASVLFWIRSRSQ
jgi:hypothetical protein